MQLKTLEITINSATRRLIKFHQGLNIITNRPDSGRTGNSVGKSTLSRVVDYLMLGSISSIYIDEEFKKPNKTIEELFNNNRVIASLSFVTPLGVSQKISRTLATSQKDEEYFINGSPTDSKTYEVFIQKEMFDISTRRPSIRSVIPKFIRNDTHRMLNTTKFLDAHASAKDYSEVFLYLFDFHNTSLLTEKRDASNLVARKARNSKAINAMIREQKPSTEIKEYQNSIKELEENLLTFDYAPEHKNPIQRLSELQDEEEKLTTKILANERKLNNISETIDLLTRNKDGYLIKEMKAIYDYSGASIDGALRGLEDTILFHKNLIEKKKKYLTIDIPDLKRENLDLSIMIELTRSEKLDIFSEIKSRESIENITNKLKKLGELKLNLGKLQGFIEQQEKAKTDLTVANQQLHDIISQISKETERVKEFTKVANKHFKAITKKLHGEEYNIKIEFNEESGACDIEIINSATNPEGGKKKAEVIAFDFAYIHAAHELSAKRPLFVFHDSIEDIDKKQITEIINLSKELPGQQILSILSDSIERKDLDNLKDNVILLLDENDKFFGV